MRVNDSLKLETSFNLSGYAFRMQTTYLELDIVTVNGNKKWYVLKFLAKNNGQN